MKLQIVSKNKAFTLIEIILVLTIFISLLAIGTFIEPKTHNKRLLSSEHDILISILLKARNQSMNNINGKKYGIHIDSDSYIIFNDFPYDKNNINNISFPKNKNIKITASPILLDQNNEIEIIFNQLSGEIENEGQIKMEDDLMTKYINLIKNGLIIN
jgi:type II secretory pathway pseudopilin PulG